MKIVKFIAGMPPYNIGEIAGFEDTKADELVNKGIAEYFTVETRNLDEPIKDKMVKKADVKKGS